MSGSGVQPGDRTPTVRVTTCTSCGKQRALTDTEPCVCGGRGMQTVVVPQQETQS